MKTYNVKCPYDGHWYHGIPGLRTWEKPLSCPVCGAKQIPDGGIKDGTAGTEDAWPHQEIERTFLTDEEAIKIFKKYAKKQYSGAYHAGRELFEDAYHSQWWPSGNYGYKREDWMGDDLVLAFQWYLDAHGRFGNYIKMPEGTMDRNELKKIEKDIDEMISDARDKKRKQQYEARKRKEKRDEEKGKAVVATLNPGDVTLVKFGGYWGDRGMKVLEIEDEFIAGFYLDREIRQIPFSSPEIEGYFYTKPSKWITVKVNGEWVPGKFEWDGKTFIKTRTYETKMIKFVKEKVENAIIKK